MIRKIIVNDKEKFISLANKFYNSDAVSHPAPQENILNTFYEMTNNSDYIFGYIIEKESAIIGYVVITKMFSPEVGGFCLWIEQIFILEEYRNKGYAKELFDFIFCEFNGYVKRIRLEAVKENISALNLYSKLGFKELGYLQLTKDF